MPITYVALGANLGDRLAALQQAVDDLRLLGDVNAVSPAYETEPVGYAEQPAFLNAVARLRTNLSPALLLAALHEIEQRSGRVRTFRNAPRTLDLDLLLYDDLNLDTPDLLLPHPRMHERAFVLVPLADIAPEVIHPGSGRTVAEMLAGLGDRDGVRPVGSLALGAPSG